MSHQFDVSVDENSDKAMALIFDFGDTLENAVKLWGTAAVYSRFLQGATINLQGGLRAAMKKSELPTDKKGKGRPMTLSETQAWLKKFTVESVSEKQSKVAKVVKVADGMSPEEIAELKAYVAGLK